MIDTLSVLPPGIEPWLAAVLVASSVFTSSVSAGAGMGGGSMMLAILAIILPQPALIPIHGVLQLGSNFSRCLFMRAHLQYVTFGVFSVGTVLGAIIGGLAALQVPQDLMLACLGLFILWSVWGRMPSAIQNSGMLAGGFASGIMTMFVGATGPFVAAFLRPFIHERMPFVAVHSACMTIQHTVKLVVFGLLGFAYGPYLVLTLAMVAGSFLGSYIGRHILIRLGDVWFQKILKFMLTVAGLRLIWGAVT